MPTFSNITVVIRGTEEGRRKALEAFDAREAKEAKRAAITPEERLERELELDRKRAEEEAKKLAEFDAVWGAFLNR
jgi:hypothetical protein